jgi:hypothetical protein
MTGYMVLEDSRMQVDRVAQGDPVHLYGAVHKHRKAGQGQASFANRGPSVGS